MNRKECLEEAAKAVLSDRNRAYGDPEDNFRETAALLRPLFQRVAAAAGGDPSRVEVEPWMVAWAMNQLKAARTLTSPEKPDHWVDIAGYAACGAECATKAATDDAVRDEGWSFHLGIDPANLDSIAV